jgi:hypothetical protein
MAEPLYFELEEENAPRLVLGQIQQSRNRDPLFLRLETKIALQIMGDGHIRQPLHVHGNGPLQLPREQFHKILLPRTAAMASRGTGGISV